MGFDCSLLFQFRAAANPHQVHPPILCCTTQNVSTTRNRNTVCQWRVEELTRTLLVVIFILCYILEVKCPKRASLLQTPQHHLKQHNVKQFRKEM